MRTALLAAFTALFFTAPALAQDNNTIMLPPAGTTVINLEVSESTKLAQDTLSASLRYEMDGTSANETQDRINKAIAEALAEAKKSPSVKTSTGYYQVYVYDQDNSIDPRTGQPLSTRKKWRGSQTVELKATDAGALLELAGKIQTMGFTMNGLTYSLSPEKAESVRDDLFQKALKKLGEKAKIAQTALGKSSYDILDITVDSAQPAYPVAYGRMAMMSAKAEMADAVSAPTASADEAQVSLSLSARVLLK